MRTALFLGVLAIGLSAQAQEAPRLFDADLALRRQAVEGIAAGDRAAEWALLPEAYAKQPSEIRRAILDALPQFFDRFTPIVRDQPESRLWAEIAERQRIEMSVLIDEIRAGDPQTEEAKAQAKAKVDALLSRIKFPSREEIAKVRDRTAAIGISLFRQGIADPELRSLALQTLRTVGLKHSTLTLTGRGICGNGDDAWMTAADAVGNLLEEQAKIDAEPLLTIAKTKAEGYAVASMILVKIENPEATGLVRKLLQSQNEGEATAGMHCTILSPREEYWPLLMAILAKGKEGFANSDAFEPALHDFPRAEVRLYAEWSRLGAWSRAQALQCLWSVNSKAMLRLTLVGLRDVAAAVRVAAVERASGLTEVDSRKSSDLTEADRAQALRALLPMLDDPDAKVRNSALLALGQDHLSFEVAARLAKDVAALVRRQAADLLPKYDDVRAIPLLMTLVADPDEGVRSAARDSLILMGELAFEAIKRGLKDRNEYVRAACAVAICEFKDPSLAEDVRKLLKDTSAEVRASAVEALATYGDQWTNDILKLVQDKDARVRAAAIEGLTSIEGPAGLEALQKALRLVTGAERKRVQEAIAALTEG